MRLHFTSDGFVLAVSSPGRAGNACLVFIPPSRCLCLTRQRALAGEVSGSRWGLPSAPLVLASVAPQLLLELYPVRGLFHSRVARLILKKKKFKIAISIHTLCDLISKWWQCQILFILDISCLKTSTPNFSLSKWHRNNVPHDAKQQIQWQVVKTSTVWKSVNVDRLISWLQEKAWIAVIFFILWFLLRTVIDICFDKKKKKLWENCHLNSRKKRKKK